jgi:hypothetical protein
VVPADSDRPCPNPACEAFPLARPEAVLAARAEQAARARRQAEREAISRAQIAASEEYWRGWAQEATAAEEAGYCTVCFRKSKHRKRVRHRTPDYHEQKGA